MLILIIYSIFVYKMLFTSIPNLYLTIFTVTNILLIIPFMYVILKRAGIDKITSICYLFFEFLNYIFFYLSLMSLKFEDNILKYMYFIGGVRIISIIFSFYLLFRLYDIKKIYILIGLILLLINIFFYIEITAPLVYIMQSILAAVSIFTFRKKKLKEKEKND